MKHCLMENKNLLNGTHNIYEAMYNGQFNLPIASHNIQDIFQCMGKGMRCLSIKDFSN